MHISLGSGQTAAETEEAVVYAMGNSCVYEGQLLLTRRGRLRVVYLACIMLQFYVVLMQRMAKTKRTAMGHKTKTELQLFTGIL